MITIAAARHAPPEGPGVPSSLSLCARSRRLAPLASHLKEPADDGGSITVGLENYLLVARGRGGFLASVSVGCSASAPMPQPGDVVHRQGGSRGYVSPLFSTDGANRPSIRSGSKIGGWSRSRMRRREVAMIGPMMCWCGQMGGLPALSPVRDFARSRHSLYAA